MSGRFSFTETSLSGVWIAQRKVFEDSRGAFNKLFSADEFQKAGVEKPITQINHSITRSKGTVRGLHFQHPPHVETRIVSCLKGEIFDVAVDLRKGSKTFLFYRGERLSAQNQRSLIIPEGFAHGFQALTDDCELVYLHTGFYVPEADGGLNVEDKRLGIAWPLPVSGLSERDKGHAFIRDDYDGVRL
jgi:dTDP-4-dehydrorhamnose 3,5-epimerase